MAISIFDTRAEYEASTPSTSESTISHIIDTNEVEINGVMVVTPRPKKGDICCLDSDRQIRYISLETFSLALLPAGWVAVGFVEWRHGRKVKISRVLSSTYAWAKYFLWEITNYTADGEEHAFSFKVTVSGTDYTCSGNYSGNDINAVAASMNTIVSAFDFGGHQYHVYVRGTKLILQHDTYTTYLGVTATGVTVTAAVGAEIPALASIPRYNGDKGGDGAIANLDRALIYFRSDMASGTYNPATDVTSIARAAPICLPAYLGTSANNDDHCALLRAYYGAGESGWIKFMQAVMAIWPAAQGSFNELAAGDAKKNTYALAGQLAQKHDGTSDQLYPAFDAAAAVAFEHDDFKAGKWTLPTIGDLTALKRGITYPAVYQEGTGSVSVAAKDADPISRACYKLGMTQVANNSFAWSCSRYNTNNAWNFYGYGYCYGNNFCGKYQCVVSALSYLPQAD